MGERKVINKYIPHDFNPAKIPRRKYYVNKHYLKVRTMLSMSIRCNLCGNYIGRGTKFNSRKEEVIGTRYLNRIKIFRFYIRCSTCSRVITILTDPENSDYIVESGALRNFEPWRAEEGKKGDEGLRDHMKGLENRARVLKREMENVAALEELRCINSRRSKVSVDAMINNLASKEDKLCEEDEGLIKSKFSGLMQESVRRIDDSDDDEEEIVSTFNSLKKRKVSGDFTCARRILGSATSGGKLSLSHISAVKKNPDAKEVETTRNKDKADNTLQSLFKDYESDEEDS